MFRVKTMHPPAQAGFGQWGGLQCPPKSLHQSLACSIRQDTEPLGTRDSLGRYDMQQMSTKYLLVITTLA